ncbi:uncharacterized protein BDV14DRAFT_171587 [Aspergillus stella-maris]|uniref:uncharacterized protein n=1 Tax=Aspergillus stella-maris TaxID=1810926 RepID=UPI003CCD50F9
MNLSLTALSLSSILQLALATLLPSHPTHTYPYDHFPSHSITPNPETPTIRTPPYSIAETIRHRKSQYSRFSDTAQWPLFSALLHPSLTASFHNPDGSIIVSPADGFEYSFSNRKDYVEFWSRSNTGLRAIHVVGPGELSMLGEGENGDGGEVSAVWGVIWLTQTGSLEAEMSSGNGTGVGLGGGHYHEVWRRVEGEWVIIDLKLVLAFNTVIPVG